MRTLPWILMIALVAVIVPGAATVDARGAPAHGRASALVGPGESPCQPYCLAQSLVVAWNHASA